ncbi:hypothetical protein BHE97_06075 [Aeromicrobium sp. PE09-221]|uniref:sigma-70 family RNA polymerase sigma factor n=1 Tax=Aeromicrobium sp. PE09-221 TaxID=1898043 RepID=UPI000B3EAF1F|nr:sigma-70 family RNA polymerase sigma factor [Aeromicrobium sp. PE09-221]OUZ10996.1 hypothetical protein BHE97_06075 [Aeromicrobium sp. PE09-221]
MPTLNHRDDLDTLVRTHHNLALTLARRYRQRGVELADLEQVALTGLVRAAQRYDAEHGAFAPFATATIHGEIKHHFRDSGWTIRPPRRLQELQARLNALRADAETESGEELSIAELAERLGEPIDEVRRAASLHHCFAPTAPTTPDGEQVIEQIGTEDSEFERVEETLELRSVLRDLEDSDRELLRMRFYDELSQREIAIRIGCSQMQVCRRLRRLVAELRGRLEVAAA